MFLRRTPSLASAIMAGLFLMMAVGCQPEVAPKEKALPKMDFHKPKEFKAAVDRIRELHDAFCSEDSLPDPISYTVVEVSHSHGEGDSHVHYHLFKEKSHDHEHEDDHDHEGDHEHEDDHDHADGDHDHEDDHDHDHGDENELKKHVVTVDIFTELKDIVRWLPAIASNGDMSQDNWEQAKQISDAMSDHLDAMKGSGVLSEQRTRYQSDSTAMQKWTVELETLAQQESKSE